MINLLPYNERKNVGREYQLRRLVIILAGCLVVELLALVALTPSFVLALYKDKAAVAGSMPTTSADTSASDFKKQIDTAKAVMSVLAPDPQIMMPSAIVPLLVKDKPQDTVVTDISYSVHDSSAVEINVKGIAGTRESLSSFTDALTHEPGISSVDVPVSDFTKDANIGFGFTITVKNPQK